MLTEKWPPFYCASNKRLVLVTRWGWLLLVFLVQRLSLDHHCVMSLGVEDGRIQDSAMSASTIAGSNHAANLARLNLVAVSSKAGAWCSNKLNDQQWLKIDLGILTTVTKVATQGRQDSSHWVTSYFISYSINNSYWANYIEDGEKKVKGK